MADPPVLTLVVVGDALGTTPMATALEQRFGGVSAHIRTVDRPNGIRAALAACSTPFLSVVQSQGTSDGRRLERHLEALRRHPIAALTVDWSPPIDGPTDDAGGDKSSREIDGRAFGRAVLFGDVPASALTSAVLLRTDAINAELPAGNAHGHDDRLDWLRLLMQVLIRGSVWQDSRSPDGLTRPTPDPIRPGHPAWLDVMEAATDAGLFSEPNDTSRALTHHTRRVADLLDGATDAEPSDHVPGTARADVQGLLRAWTLLINAGHPQATRTLERHGDWLPQSPPRARRQRLEKFVIVAPDYTEIHGGVVALHRLCDRLNAIGYQAFIEPIGERGETRPDWRTPLRRGRTLDDAVVIYPEIVTGNLCGARRVVRWLLNRPAWFTGAPMAEGADDLIVSFNTQISSDHPVLTVPLIDPTVFFPKERPGQGGLLWIGKGVPPNGFDRRPTILITDTWPTKRVELADLLRRADVLYTCDWLTSVIDEALMCGTQVVLVGEQVWSREEVETRLGLAWEDNVDLSRGREEAGRYFDSYLDSLGTVDAAVEEFVQLVNDHFARVEAGSPADACQ